MEAPVTAQERPGRVRSRTAWLDRDASGFVLSGYVTGRLCRVGTGYYDRSRSYRGTQIRLDGKGMRGYECGGMEERPEVVGLEGVARRPVR